MVVVGEEGLDADRVVDADRGHVAGTQAVAQHLHAGAVEATHDRTADAGAEVGRLHAGEFSDGLAEGIRLDLIEPGAGQYLDGADQILGRADQRGGFDFDAGQVLGLMGMVLVVGLGGQGEGGGEGEGEREAIQQAL